MPIKLHGLPFDVRTMSELSDQLAKHGYNLDDFVISKSLHPRPARGWGREYDYGVSVQGKGFSMTFASDQFFAKFFYDLCCSPDDKPEQAGLVERLLIKIEHGIEATERWLMEDPFKS